MISGRSSTGHSDHFFLGHSRIGRDGAEVICIRLIVEVNRGEKDQKVYSVIFKAWCDCVRVGVDVCFYISRRSPGRQKHFWQNFNREKLSLPRAVIL